MNHTNITKQEVDLVLQGGTAITVDEERRVIRDAGIAVQGEDIVFVGKATEVSERYLAKRTVDCNDKLMIPGLVNAHVHYSHHLSKGLIPDNLGGVLFSNFLHSTVTPNLTVEDEKIGAKALLLEMLKGGTTMYLEPATVYPFEIIRSEIQDFGIKGVMGRRCFDLESLGHGSERKGKPIETTDEILEINERFLKEFSKEKLRIRPIVTIVGMTRFTDRLAIESKKMADRYGVHLKMHLANRNEYVTSNQAQTGLRPVEYLEKLGILDENVILVHMTYVTQKEVDMLAKHGTKVVHCPAVALKLSVGLHHGRFPEMLHAGIPVALGSDCSDCANYHDMVRTMYLAAVLYKDIRLDPELMGAETAIEMATINGAKTIGMENEIGSLEVGKKADIVIFDTNRLELRPLYNEVQTLVYSANAEMVESVIIDGRFVMEKRKVLTVDEEEVLAEIRLREKELKTILNIPVTSPKWEFV